MKARLTMLQIIGLLFSCSVAFADPRLGDNVGMFRAKWGPPFRQEILERTATWRWTNVRLDQGAVDAAVQVDVAFLDQRACEIVLRTKRRPSRGELLVIMQRFVRPSKANGRIVERHADIGQLYEIEGQAVISAKNFRGRSVIVITGACYTDNEEIFSREAASIRPPTSNH